MPSPLFPNWSWNGPLPDEFASLPLRNKEDCSKYNPQTGGARLSTLHGPTLAAIMTYIGTEEGSGADESNGALGTQDNGKIIVAEFPSSEPDGIHGVVFNTTTGKFNGSKIVPGKSMVKEEIEESCESLAALLFTVMPLAMKDDEFPMHYSLLKKALRSIPADQETLRKSGAILCDNLYRRITNAANLGDAGIKIAFDKSDTLKPLSMARLNRGDYEPEKVLLGTFKALNSAKTQKKASTTHSQFSGKYMFQEDREFSEKEKLMIPKLESWYIIPPEVEMLCEHAKKTTGSTIPMRNFLLRGPAGSGKTEAAKAMAAGLHLPYKHFTCSADTEILDLLGQMLPVTDEEASPGYTDLPTFEDISMDPGTAFYKLTGEYKEVSEEVVYQTLLNTLEKRIQKGRTESGYRFVDSPIIEAMEKGYLIELQEPSCISKPGVLVGLNSLLDNCRSVTLPTGKIIQRHPDTVFVITTNKDYAGVRDMNQSLLSRLMLKVEVKEPEAGTLVKRAMNITGCTQKGVVANMVKCVKAISKKCQADMITDGCCGSRELFSWVQSYMITQDEMISANYTVIPSATSDEEAQAELISTCLNPVFGV